MGDDELPEMDTSYNRETPKQSQMTKERNALENDINILEQIINKKKILLKKFLCDDEVSAKKKHFRKKLETQCDKKLDVLSNANSAYNNAVYHKITDDNKYNPYKIIVINENSNTCENPYSMVSTPCDIE